MQGPYDFLLKNSRQEDEKEKIGPPLLKSHQVPLDGRKIAGHSPRMFMSAFGVHVFVPENINGFTTALRKRKTISTR